MAMAEYSSFIKNIKNMLNSKAEFMILHTFIWKAVFCSMAVTPFFSPPPIFNAYSAV